MNTLVDIVLKETNEDQFKQSISKYLIEKRKNQNIEAILMSNLSIKDNELTYYLNQSLKVVDFSECTKLTSKGIQQISNLAPNLTHLFLRAIPNLDGQCLVSFTAITNLECLDLSQNYFDPKQLHVLTKLSKLRELFVWECRLIKDEDLSWLKNKKLEILDISSCNQLTNDCLPYLTNIENVFLDGINFINTDGITQLTQDSKYLKRLSLDLCPEVEVSLFAEYLYNSELDLSDHSS